MRTIFRETDKNHDGAVSFPEFVRFFIRYSQRSRARASIADADGDEEEKPEGTEGQILREALVTLGIGSVVVLLFSDPMCAVLNEVGRRTGIPAFYIAFVIAPIASNGAEIIAAYNFASKKTEQSVSVSFNTLLGAANMNNSFCLAIFMAIISFSAKEKNIHWEYAAESISIVFSELVMYFFAIKTTHTLFDGYCVLAIYPVCIAMVAILEGAGLN